MVVVALNMMTMTMAVVVVAALILPPCLSCRKRRVARRPSGGWVTCDLHKHITDV